MVELLLDRREEGRALRLYEFQPPTEEDWEVGDGSGRRLAWPHAGDHPSRRTRRDPPGRDQVLPERLRRLRTRRGGRWTPHHRRHSS